MYTTIHNLFKTLHKLYTNTYKRLHSSTHLLQHFTKRYTTWQHFTHIYNNFTQFCNTLTQLYTTIQNSTQLYRTWKSYRQNYKTLRKLYNKKTSIFDSISKHQDIQHYIKLSNILQKKHSDTTTLYKHLTQIIKSHI